MTTGGQEQLLAPEFWDRRTQRLRNPGLAWSRNVIVLGFHRHQGRARDGVQVHAVAVNGQRAVGQGGLEEDVFDVLQKEFCRDIHQ